MEIVFRRELRSVPSRDPEEIFSAEIALDNGQPVVTIKASDEEMDYASFQSEVYRDLLTMYLETTGQDLLVFDEDPIADFDAFDYDFDPDFEGDEYYGFHIEDDDPDWEDA